MISVLMKEQEERRRNRRGGGGGGGGEEEDGQQEKRSEEVRGDGYPMYGCVSDRLCCCLFGVSPERSHISL
jgi:hypothetical protein